MLVPSTFSTFCLQTILIFCKANQYHLYNLYCMFLCFKTISGLRIGLTRSDLVPVGNVNNVEGLASILRL
jgi:hypothetical protein